MVLAKAWPGIRFNEQMEGDGPTVFAHACKIGLEGIVSKRKDSAFRPLARLAQEELKCTGGETGSGRGLGPVSIMRACLETQKLEQLEARMDEIADRVARDRTNAARERTSTHEA
jgi:hypothetical protein